MVGLLWRCFVVGLFVFLLLVSLSFLCRCLLLFCFDFVLFIFFPVGIFLLGEGHLRVGKRGGVDIGHPD